MGKRGPKPTPTHILKARGSREAYNRKGEPDDLPGIPEMHPMVEGDDEASRLWRKMRDRLGRMRVWTEQHSESLATYCMLWSQLVRYYRGELELTTAAWNQLTGRVLQYQREFGCTPASKTTLRVEGDEPQAEDPDSKYGVVG